MSHRSETQSSSVSLRAKYLKIDVKFTNSLGVKFVLIPPGEFTMGSTAAEIEAALGGLGEGHWYESIKSEDPQHKVVLTQPIYLGVNEVTQAEYEKVMGTNPSRYAPMGRGKAAVAGMETTHHRVEMVSWNDTAEFCAKLSQQERFKPFYFRAGESKSGLRELGLDDATTLTYRIRLKAIKAPPARRLDRGSKCSPHPHDSWRSKWRRPRSAR